MTKWHHIRFEDTWTRREGDILLVVERIYRLRYVVWIHDLTTGARVTLGNDGLQTGWETVRSAQRNALRYGLDPAWRRRYMTVPLNAERGQSNETTPDTTEARKAD